ncbi:glucuronate isomerase [Geomicrobium sp. JSM 1781026]|uniref:glucuronate isomerase n=1 Tax=Geomicrobium sp. JSM 1781026 TaxID=3344580 RepID=UPI0035BF748D
MLISKDTFIDDHFLLNSDAAKQLYHDYAKEMPIIDYHCHVPPNEIEQNRKFENISEIWLHGDHYKWRAMRMLGVDESYITGDKSDKEKFMKWAACVPKTIGNPLFHWTHLELKRYFDVNDMLSEMNAEKIWDKVNADLQGADLTTRKIIEKSNVELICTTDDPIDSLASHKRLSHDKEFEVAVLPAFRPDKVLQISSPAFQEYVQLLSEASNARIEHLDDLIMSLEKRMTYFHEHGCRISDHGIYGIPFSPCSKEEATRIFLKALNGEQVSMVDEEKYQTFVLRVLGQMYHDHNWTMQLHISAMRNNNSKWFEVLGADTGFDTIGDQPIAAKLNGFLNELEKDNALPKTILYSVNPQFNEVIASALGAFSANGQVGKIQFGSAWWFNDHKEGMTKHMSDLANIGLLSTFVGMLTDSRSFLSYTRHEYFRRVLCRLIGEWVENGEAPKDYKYLGDLVQNISYWNAKHYFKFPM